MKNKQMTSLIDLFNKQNVQYFVGILQRNMDWIITDMKKYYYDLTEDTKLKINGEKSQHHFMNGVVFKPLEKTGLLHYISITDGQQRMISTYLHVCAICAFVKNNDIPKNEFDYESIKRTLLINPEQEGDDKYKLLLRKKDRDTLKMIVDELPASLGGNAGNSPKIITAYNYLYQQLNRINYKETFDKLFLMDTLPFIVEPWEDENVIFDSINNGGRKLSLFDNARSFALSSYTLKKGEEIESKCWDKIAESKSPSSFIRMYCLFHHGETTERNAYNKFKELSLSYSNKDKFNQNVSEFYDEYYKVITANTGDGDIDYLLQGLGLIYPHGEFTAILKICILYSDGSITKPTLINSLKLLLSVGVRWITKVKNTSVFRNILEYNTHWINSENLYNSLYKKLTPFFVSDSQFEMKICEMNFYKGKKGFEEENQNLPSNINKITKYLLGCIENHYYPKGRINFEILTLEHVCPQTLDNGWDHFFNPELHHDNVHRLGNLTLTAYNSEYSNLSFEDKKNMSNGFKEDKLYLSKSICNYHTWSVDSIQQRTELLAGELCEIFSIPPNNLRITDNNSQSILSGCK